LLQLIQLSKYEIKIQMDFNVIDSVINAVFFCTRETVSGVVSDASGPIHWCERFVKGTNRSIQTDFDGKYTIKAKVGEALMFSYIGMKEASVTVGATL
jgi:hypothetical protein